MIKSFPNDNFFARGESGAIALQNGAIPFKDLFCKYFS